MCHLFPKQVQYSTVPAIFISLVLHSLVILFIIVCRTLVEYANFLFIESKNSSRRHEVKLIVSTLLQDTPIGILAYEWSSVVKLCMELLQLSDDVQSLNEFIQSLIHTLLQHVFEDENTGHNSKADMAMEELNHAGNPSITKAFHHLVHVTQALESITEALAPSYRDLHTQKENQSCIFKTRLLLIDKAVYGLKVYIEVCSEVNSKEGSKHASEMKKHHDILFGVFSMLFYTFIPAASQKAVKPKAKMTKSNNDIPNAPNALFYQLISSVLQTLDRNRGSYSDSQLSAVANYNIETLQCFVNAIIEYFPNQNNYFSKYYNSSNPLMCVSQSIEILKKYCERTFVLNEKDMDLLVASNSAQILGNILRLLHHMQWWCRPATDPIQIAIPDEISPVQIIAIDTELLEMVFSTISIIGSKLQKFKVDVLSNRNHNQSAVSTEVLHCVGSLSYLISLSIIVASTFSHGSSELYGKIRRKRLEKSASDHLCKLLVDLSFIIFHNSNTSNLGDDKSSTYDVSDCTAKLEMAIRSLLVTVSSDVALRYFCTPLLQNMQIFVTSHYSGDKKRSIHNLSNEVNKNEFKYLQSVGCICNLLLEYCYQPYSFSSSFRWEATQDVDTSFAVITNIWRMFQFIISSHLRNEGLSSSTSSIVAKDHSSNQRIDIIIMNIMRRFLGYVNDRMKNNKYGATTNKEKKTSNYSKVPLMEIEEAGGAGINGSRTVPESNAHDDHKMHGDTKFSADLYSTLLIQSLNTLMMALNSVCISSNGLCCLVRNGAVQSHSLLTDITAFFGDIVGGKIALLNTNIAVINGIVFKLMQLAMSSIQFSLCQDDTTLSSHEEHERVSRKDFISGLGRSLMHISNSPQLYKHLGLIICSCVSCFCFHQTSYKRICKNINVAYPMLCQEDDGVLATSTFPVITISDETIKEYIMPGVFSLIDKYNINLKRNREVLYKTLKDLKAQHVLNDILQIYQTDFKFVGKS